MLKILKKNNEIKIQEILEEGYTDITSVSMWIGVTEKIGFDKTEAKKQIELFIKSLGENIDDYNKIWYDEYNKDLSNNF
tara:strand:+ start:5763 stop:5999 length:237 start_codon:yes stop_codon:yes gene_type:complete